MSAPTITRPPATGGTVAPPRPAPPLRVLPGSPQDRTRWDRVRFDGTAARHAPTDDRRPATPAGWAGGHVPDLPDPRTWAGTLVRAAVEALLGMRAPAQLSRWLDAELWTALNRRAILGVQIDGRPPQQRTVTVRRVHACEVAPDTWEASVVVDDGERVRASALRLEVRRGRWHATALQIG